MSGCQQEQEGSPDNTGVVEANDAYIEHFGDVPPVKAGRAYANVAYLPLKEQPEKIGALPVFLFTAENRRKLVLEKLISGDLVSTPRTRFYHPFPSDLALEIHPLDGRVLTVNLRSSTTWNPKDQRAAVNAIKETALQFAEIASVRILFNGTAPADMPRDGYQHRASQIAETKAPVLILMGGNWESDQEDPEEILIEFDRPVKIQNISLMHEDGSKVIGDYYVTMFQMAVVVHPESPELFKEGSILRVEWRVVDFKGRENSGVDTLPLIRYEH